MLQIRLSNPASEGGGGAKALPVDTVTVACPDHLVLADLPVAKSIGSATAGSLVKTVGRRSRRQLGERVHFCVRCDFPIAIYGRLSPCEHAFCLDCARSDSICYLCDERIQKIQTIKMMEGIFICAAPHCLKSFLKKSEFESHIHRTHADLLQPNREKEDVNESEGVSAKQSTALDSTGRAPTRPVFSPNSSSQVNDREDKASRSQPRDQPPPRSIVLPKPPQPLFGQIQSHPSEPQTENNRPQGFDRPGSHNPYPQQGFGTQGGLQQESGQLLDKQQGILSEIPFSEYSPMSAHPPPNYAVPINSNPVLAPPPFGYPPFPPEGARPFYGAPYEMARPDSAPEVGSEQGSLLGFPPGPAGGVNFSDGYPRPWIMGPAGVPFQAYIAGQGIEDGSANMSDSQGRVAYFHSDYGRDTGVLASNMPPSSANKGMEPVQDAMEPRDSRGILAPQPLPHPPLPPPPPPHLSQQLKRAGRDGQNFGWQNEKRDSFGSGQDL
ncbi:E3 ubiquitin-protein ligase HAKAI homolog [Cornus florida]|uniref:E3 ubiquitin-protein ligase HAKAI homolog n=1 Tax=Cornus florida TaxID=4283 RepID=UPI002897FB9F|nr:E3 ubiquitin-protein ligase HAKAI homolog [Cornus florida]XP_059667908.1 E3 ubiquitin-protein ligase HAKAI homolog [Cornus florida]